MEWSGEVNSPFLKISAAGHLCFGVLVEGLLSGYIGAFLSSWLLEVALATDSGLLNFLIGVGGLVLLLRGSGWMIDGAACIAARMRIPETVVGLTLVSPPPLST